MSQDGVPVHMQSEEYKIGWVHGFYDCVADDGAFYGRSSLPYAFADGHGSDAARLYRLGYGDGTTARLAGVFKRLGHPVDPETRLQHQSAATKLIKSTNSLVDENPTCLAGMIGKP
jgi:hypothetical protein